MSISRNLILKNARQFSKDWKDETSEKAESQTFWNEFFAVFGISRRQVGVFEAKLTKLGGHRGFIDVFWTGKLICEQKSRGQDLDKAFHQAIEYLEATAKVNPQDLPRYVIVCDFEFLRLYDLESNNQTEILVAELAENIHLFNFLHDQITEIKQAEESANIEAAEKMGKLHSQLKAVGYDGHALEVMLIRLLFCLFAEDTGIFEKYQFSRFIQNKTQADGSDLAAQLSYLFHVLNQAEDKRLKNLDADLAEFAYINGQLFSEFYPPASFDDEMRNLLLEACEMDWSKISPEIFGSLFQSVMNKTERRALGAHYTGEDNILKVVSSLFLDDLRAEFDVLRKKGRNAERVAGLNAFHQRLASLRFLDPACGCGNFLIVTYRELRLLELDVIGELYKKDQLLDVSTIVRCNVNQLHGIEIEDFPTQIARVAMWLIDHQMNMLVSQHYGTHFARIPLKTSADIQNANALTNEWPEVDYILGNPPFIGHQWRTKEQQADLEKVFPKGGKFGKVDFVGAWFIKAAQIMKNYPQIKTAFVSTNSITQGEQVGVLWGWIFAQGLHIHFAHRTFQWSSAAKGKAAVHCVIIGFGSQNDKIKYLFDYPNIQAEPEKLEVKQINQYLVAAPSIIIPSRSNPRNGMPTMTKGSQPTDGGNLVLNEDEKNRFSNNYPILTSYIKPYIGGNELINNIKRYCFWFADADNNDLKKIISIPEIKQRIENIKQVRLKSPTSSVQEFSEFPLLFTQNRQPKGHFLAIPEVSSERRRYIPIGFMNSNTIPSNKIYMIPNVGLYEFGIMTSEMQMAWMRTICGRLKSDYSYSPNIYHLFPWLKEISEAHKKKISQLAQKVLDARSAEFSKNPATSLATLYDPDIMPMDLRKAHQALDKAVDAAYSKRKFKNEADRVAFLFAEYEILLQAEAGVVSENGK